MKHGTPCPNCDELRALTVAEVNTDPLLPHFIKELIVPNLKRQRELQRLVAGSAELAYRRGNQEGREQERARVIKIINKPYGQVGNEVSTNSVALFRKRILSGIG